jgi:hypothetical protein
MKYLLIFWSVVVLACQPNNLQESKKELINTFEEMGKAITDGGCLKTQKRPHVVPSKLD